MRVVRNQRERQNNQPNQLYYVQKHFSLINKVRLNFLMGVDF